MPIAPSDEGNNMTEKHMQGQGLDVKIIDSLTVDIAASSIKYSVRFMVSGMSVAPAFVRRIQCATLSKWHGVGLRVVAANNEDDENLRNRVLRGLHFVKGDTIQFRVR